MLLKSLKDNWQFEQNNNDTVYNICKTNVL